MSTLINTMTSTKFALLSTYTASNTMCFLSILTLQCVDIPDSWRDGSFPLCPTLGDLTGYPIGHGIQEIPVPIIFCGVSTNPFTASRSAECISAAVLNLTLRFPSARFSGLWFPPTGGFPPK